MAYNKVGWENLPQQTTPLSAENLNHMDKGIAELDTRVTTLEQGGGTGGVGVRSEVGTNNELFNDTSSHTIEGDDTTKNNHIEGSKNKVIKAHKDYPNENNHVEGKNNIAGGYAGHVENNSNQTYETNAHAGGVSSVASGAGTFAQGRGVIAMGLGSVATGQSLYSDGSTTVLGVDGEETDIDWTTRADETEQQRSKRISDRIEGLYLGTELKQDGTPNTSVQRKFLASLGIGNMVGGVNSFARGTANLVHGLSCRSLSSYCFASGYSTWIGKNSDDCFAFGDNLRIGDNAKDTIVLGTAHNVEASGAFVAGYQCTIKPTAKNSFTLGKNCWVEAPNSYALGERIFINQDGQTVFGKYNDNNSKAAFVVGTGSSDDRHNSFEVYDNYAKIGTSSFESLKLKAQTLSTAAEDTTYIFYNDEKKLNWVEDGNPAQYEMSPRPLQLLISIGATADEQLFHRIIVKSVVENDTEIRITVASHWALNLEQLVGKTPDKLNYIILRNNVGTPFGNYKVFDNNKQVANLSLNGKTYQDGAIALGQGALSIAPFALTGGQANAVTVRRGTALSGEQNNVFNWASTAFGAWNNVFGGLSFAAGTCANVLAYGAMNFGGGLGYFNPRNKDGSMKSLEQIISESRTDPGLIPNINYGQHSFVGGYGNIAGAHYSTVFGSRNTIDADGINSLVIGTNNINKVANSLVFGDGVTNTDSLLNINSVFKVLPDGANIAKSYQGEGSKINVAKVVEANPSVEPKNITFKTLTVDDYTNGNLTTNTEKNPGSVNYGLEGVIDYSSKTTFWHNNYDVIDGTSVPNPQLTDDNPYMISLKVDAEMVKTFTNQLVIRFYPREQQDTTTGAWSITDFPVNVRIRVGEQSAIFNNLTAKDYSNIDTEANSSFYHDFMVPFDGVLTEGSVISFDILKVPSVSAEYPNGKFACAQGIRFGYSNYSTVTKPDVDVSTVGNIASKVNNISDGAYYSTKQLLMMIKANTPSIPENIVATDDNGNIAIKAGATIAPTDTGVEVGKIKFSEDGFGLRITSATNIGLIFDTLGVELTDNNYKLTSPSTDWTSYELGSDLDNLHNKVKNVLTTDKANIAHGYMALDSNGNIGIASGQKFYYSEHPEAGGIKFIDTAMKLTSPAECGLIIDTVGVDINFGNKKTYRLGSLGDQAPSDSTGDLMADLKKIFEAQSGTQSQVSAMLRAMATKSVISTAVTPTNTYAVNDNTEYLLIGNGAITGTLTLNFGNVSPLNDSYASYISFETGDTPPTVAINGSHVTVVFKGDDCNSEGNFIPAANKKYEVALKRVGTVDNKPYIVARVGAC